MSARSKQELIISAVVYALIAFFFVAGLRLLPDSRVFPNIILGLMTVANTVNIVVVLQKERKEKGSQEKLITFREVRFPLLAFLGAVAYVVLFVLTNYFIASAVFIVAFMLILKVRPIWLIAVITVVYSAFIYWLFVVQLSVRLIR